MLLKQKCKRIYKQTKKWGEMFTNNASLKGLISRTYKEITKFSNNKAKNPRK